MSVLWPHPQFDIIIVVCSVLELLEGFFELRLVCVCGQMDCVCVFFFSPEHLQPDL